MALLLVAVAAVWSMQLGASAQDVVIGINPITYNVSEDAGSVNVTVAVLSGTLDQDVEVSVSTVDGSATAGSDYVAVTMTLTFTNGSTTPQSVPVTILDDPIVEGSESFSLTLTTTETNVTVNPAPATVSIPDDSNDMVTIGFDPAAYTVTEGAGSVSVMVDVQGSLARDVVVTLSTMDGTAMAPDDYTAITSMELTFSATVQSQTVPIIIADGDVVEGLETFNVTLTTSDNAVVLNPVTATVDIQDDDTVQIGFENPSYVVSESAGSVMVCSILTGQLARDVVVTFFTEGGSATAPDDYMTLLPTEWTFSSGVNRACVDITIQPDGVNEVTAEMFSVNLTSDDNAVMLGSNVTTVTIVDPPVITTDPSDQTNVVPGMSATFTVVANGSDLTYQWQRAGVNLTHSAKYSGTTTASLTVMNVMEADEAVFRCIVTNAVASVPSTGAQLAVLDPPVITRQPTDLLEVVPGLPVTFSIMAMTDDGTLSYQWQRSDVDIPPTSGVSGINTSALTIASVQESNEGMYRCVVTNDAGSTSSNTAQLTVLDPPMITTQPQDRRNSIPGSTVMFSVTASGLNLTYSWEHGNGTPLPTDTRFMTTNTDTLTIQNVMPSDVGSYHCVVTNAAGSDTSDAADLTLIGPPDITDPPLSVAVENGSNAEFTCTATGLGTLTFIWTTTASVTLPPSVETINSTATVNTTTSTLSITGVTADYRGDYTCRVENERGNATSQATLIVIVIEDIMPDNVTATLGSSIMFTCSASGSEDISYRWTRTMVSTDGSLLDVGFYDGSSGRFVGVNSSMLTILNVGVVDVEEGQDYTCFVGVSGTIVGYRTAILQTRTITVEPIEADPSFNISEGETLALRCNAVNNPDAPNNLRFFWYHDDEGLVDDGMHISIVTSVENATARPRVASSELEVMDVRDGDRGRYTCRVTNRNIIDGISVDSEITVLFAPVLNFTERLQAMNRELRRNVGMDLPLTCTATAVPPATFVEIRKRNGSETVLATMQGSGSRTLLVMYTLQNLVLGDSGVYVCVASNSEGLTEQNFTLQVQDIPDEVDNTTVVRMLVSLTAVKLTWDQPEDNNAQITSYNITYCTSVSDGSCVDQTPTTISVPTTEPMAILENLIPVRTYRVYIRAENDAGLGPQSQPYFFDSANEEDAQPVNLSVPFVSETGVVLSWQLPDIAMSEQNVIFNLNYTRRGSAITLTITVPQQQGSTQGQSVGRLDPQGIYDFSVAAIYELVNSTAATVSQQPQTFDPPMIAMQPVVNQDSITISWPAPEGVEFVQNSTVFYTAINRARQSNGRKKRQTDTFSGTILVPGSQTSAQVTGSDLRPFYDYRFRVRANFGNGLVAEIVEPFHVTSAEAPPSEPQDLQVDIISHSSLTLSWDPPQFPSGVVTHYRVCIHILAHCEEPIPAQNGRNVYTLGDLRPGTTYDISVSAVNGAGEGAVNSITETTTFGVFPPVISVEGPTAVQGMYNLTFRLQNTYGPIGHYKVVVVLTGSRDIDTMTLVQDDTLLPAGQRETSGTIYYAAAAFTAAGVTEITFTVGNGQTSMLNGMTFQNNRLSAGQFYVFFIRAYSSVIPNTFNDSEVSQAYRTSTPDSTTAPSDGTTAPPDSTTAPPDSNNVGAIAGAVAGVAVGIVAVISITVIIIVVIVMRSHRAQFDLHKKDSEGAGVMSGGASEIKDIPMAERMAYGTLGMQQEEGKDVSVSQCLAGGQ